MKSFSHQLNLLRKTSKEKLQEVLTSRSKIELLVPEEEHQGDEYWSDLLVDLPYFCRVDKYSMYTQYHIISVQLDGDKIILTGVNRDEESEVRNMILNHEDEPCYLETEILFELVDKLVEVCQSTT